MFSENAILIKLFYVFSYFVGKKTHINLYFLCCGNTRGLSLILMNFCQNIQFELLIHTIVWSAINTKHVIQGVCIYVKATEDICFPAGCQSSQWRPCSFDSLHTDSLCDKALLIFSFVHSGTYFLVGTYIQTQLKLWDPGERGNCVNSLYSNLWATLVMFFYCIGKIQ